MIVGVGVSVLVLIFLGTFSGSAYEIQEASIDAIDTTVVVNEFWTPLINTSVGLNLDPIQPGTLVLTNGSGGTLSLANFTVDYYNGNLTLLTSALNNTQINASYHAGNATVKNNIKGGIINSFEALETSGSYLPLIVLAVIIALILTLVLGFGGLGKAGGMKGSAL